MTTVQSLGTTRDLNMELWPRTGLSGLSSVSLYDGTTLSYAMVYRTQPNVRIVVDFLARNIAQLGLHVFRRISDTDRERLPATHPLVDTIEHPNPRTTRYRLISDLITDLGAWGNGYWRKLPGTRRPTLLRLPPQYALPKGGLLPEYYEVYTTGQREELQPSEIVHFRMHNPGSTVMGLSPLETLRQIIAEEAASSDYREGLWKNGARHYGVIERPKDAPRWSPDEQDRFRQSVQEAYAGKLGSGRALLLEDGMTWKDTSFNSQEVQWLEGRVLSMKQAARMFHVPPPLVGILDEATYSNIEVQHQMLYQDVLPPMTVMIQEDMELQLLPDFAEVDGVYLEFNLEAKLQGSFEAQTKSLQSAVGAPYMTRNEARARLNLPRLPNGGDDVVTPLNVLIGGQANPRDSAPPDRGALQQTLSKFLRRQQAVVEARGGRFDLERWNRELTADLEGLVEDPQSMAEQINSALQRDVAAHGPRLAFTYALEEIGG